MADDVEMPDATPQDEEERHRRAVEEGHNSVEGEDSSEDEASDGEPYLAVTRERRANAGNRMARLLELAEAEQAAEEYGEIFQEAANDQEFEEQDEGDEDVNMESSSDEDEADGEQDEDAAEKEIKRQEKRENAKKQKRQSLLQQMMKKRTSAAVASAAAAGVEAGPSSLTAPPRPKKKSERVSWLPEDEQQATRASSRKLAVLNKQATHERLKEKEKHRLRTVAIMKAAEQKKEAAKPKALTQADRLAEAARIERENSRSVRKWEEIERRKEEERKAKLAASKNRKLEGPVISYYSGPALWVDDKLKHVGKSKIIADVLKESRDSSNRQNPTTNDTETKPQDQEPTPTNDGHKLHEESAVNQQLSGNAHSTSNLPSTAPETTRPDFLDGIHFYTSLPAQGTTSTHAAESSVPSTASTDPPASSATPSSTLQTDSTPSATISDILLHQHQQTAVPSLSAIPPAQSPTTAAAPLPSPSQPSQPHPNPHPHPPKHQPIRSISARTLVTLLNFQPEPKPRDRDGLLRALLSTPTHPYIPPTISRWSNRLAPAKRSLCAITDNAARYRDPLTGLTYADGYALRVIRRLVRHGEKVDGKRGGYVWCATLGCWVGEKGRAAVGVPAGFLDPTKVKKGGGEDSGGGEKMDVTT